MPKRSSSGQQFQGSQAQAAARRRLHRLWRERPLADDQLLQNIGLYTRASTLARLLFLNELYLRIVSLPGDIVEFGTWWGQNLVVFQNLRAIHEPYGTRRTIGFDTFTGYTAPGPRDRPSSVIHKGGYATDAGYERYLARLLAYHEAENSMAQVKKSEIVKGDVRTTAPAYFKRHPQQLVALAFFDMALYEPTKVALEAVLPRMVKGGVIAFDELNDPDYPGETEAMIETLGLTTYCMERSQLMPARTLVTIT